MQDFRHCNKLANEMETSPAFSVPDFPNAEIGGAVISEASQVWETPQQTPEIGARYPTCIPSPDFTTLTQFKVPSGPGIFQAAGGDNLATHTLSSLSASHIHSVIDNVPHNAGQVISSHEISEGYPSFTDHLEQAHWLGGLENLSSNSTLAEAGTSYFEGGFLHTFDQQLGAPVHQTQSNSICATASSSNIVDSFGGSIGDNFPHHVILNPPLPTLDWDVAIPFLGLNTSDAQVSQPTQSVQATAAPVEQNASIPCIQLGCFVTFKRDADRLRHEAAVHGINQRLHLCPVLGCPKSQGKAYSRVDKLTEHMWKKHGNLGFVKRI